MVDERDLPEALYDQLRDEGFFDLPPAVLASVTLAAAGASLARMAGAVVRTSTGDHSRPGGRVEYAHQVLVEAQEVLIRAVVAERASGVSWTDIGAALGVSRQAAQERYRVDVAEWDDGLSMPYEPGPGRFFDPQLPEATLAARTTAHRLDGWVRDHARPGETVDEHPVSARTVDRDDAMALTRQTAQLLRTTRFLLGGATVDVSLPPIVERVQLERKAALYEAMAAAGDTEAAELLAATRGQLDQIRGRGDRS